MWQRLNSFFPTKQKLNIKAFIKYRSNVSHFVIKTRDFLRAKFENKS